LRQSIAEIHNKSPDTIHRWRGTAGAEYCTPGVSYFTCPKASTSCTVNTSIACSPNKGTPGEQHIADADFFAPSPLIGPAESLDNYLSLRISRLEDKDSGAVCPDAVYIILKIVLLVN
jgi:hypothetical protein